MVHLLWFLAKKDTSSIHSEIQLAVFSRWVGMNLLRMPLVIDDVVAPSWPVRVPSDSNSAGLVSSDHIVGVGSAMSQSNPVMVEVS